MINLGKLRQNLIEGILARSLIYPPYKDLPSKIITTLNELTDPERRLPTAILKISLPPKRYKSVIAGLFALLPTADEKRLKSALLKLNELLPIPSKDSN